MFALDLETLSPKETAVVLSLAIFHFDEKVEYDFNEIVENCFFVKFNAKEQIEKYNRNFTKSTIDWWKNQCKIAQDISYIPSNVDINVSEGLYKAKEYINRFNGGKGIVWTRGSLDQFAIDSLCESAEIPYLFEYNQYRDFRTAIDLLKETSKNGYCDIPNFNRDIVVKHDPRQDIALDVLMLLNGK